MLHIPHRREPQDAGNCRRQTESSLPPKKPPQRPAAVSRPDGCRCPVAPQATGARPRGAGRRAVQRLTAPLFLRRKFDGVRRRAVVSLSPPLVSFLSSSPAFFLSGYGALNSSCAFKPLRTTAAWLLSLSLVPARASFRFPRPRLLHLLNSLLLGSLCRTCVCFDDITAATGSAQGCVWLSGGLSFSRG